MLGSARNARLVFAVLFLVFLLALGLVPAHDTLHGGVRLVDAQASSAPSNTAVTNNLTVGSTSISLGSVLQANGQVTANGAPLPNESVALHIGDVNIANAQTDQNGQYAFSVPVGIYYFPAAFLNGATVYTVAESQNSSYVNTPSAATNVPVNLAPLYAIIVLIVAAVILALSLYARRFREKVPAGARTRSKRAEAPVLALYARRFREKVPAGARTRSKRAEAPAKTSRETAKEPLQELKSVPASEAAIASAGKTTEEPAPQRVTKDEEYCPNCGAKNQPYAAFCAGCGRSFVAPYAPVRARPGEDAGYVPAVAAGETAKDLPPQGHKFVEAPPTKPPRAAKITEEASRPVPEPERETPKRSEPVMAAEKRAPGSYILRAEHLTKKFEDVTVVDDLNLEIKEKEVFGFLGPNGAGKTTSIKMMVGLLVPTSGRVLFDGSEVRSMPKGRIGVCPQELVLWEVLTCRENLTYMGHMYGIPMPALQERVDKLLALLSLSDKADQVVSKLSGGMKRRLNIALSLVHDPEIVFLDEPSAGLDPQTRQLLWDFIRSLRDVEGKTVVLTTHVMEEADALSDRIAIIDRGKLLLLDTPDDLKKTMGKGDIVELQLADRAMNGTILQRVSELDGIEEAYELKGRVAVRALNATSKLPEIIDIVEGANGGVSDITIRGNTLEDVFIYLTGRALRE